MALIAIIVCVALILLFHVVPEGRIQFQRLASSLAYLQSMLVETTNWLRDILRFTVSTEFTGLGTVSVQLVRQVR
jgi:type II secretory pathway component PulF